MAAVISVGPRRCCLVYMGCHGSRSWWGPWTPAEDEFVLPQGKQVNQQPPVCLRMKTSAQTHSPSHTHTHTGQENTQKHISVGKHAKHAFHTEINIQVIYHACATQFFSGTRVAVIASGKAHAVTWGDVEFLMSSRYHTAGNRRAELHPTDSHVCTFNFTRRRITPHESISQENAFWRGRRIRGRAHIQPIHRVGRHSSDSCFPAELMGVL